MAILMFTALLLLGIYAFDSKSFFDNDGKTDRVGSTFGEDINLNKLATPENPVLSPSGKYVLEVVQGYNGVVHYNRFVISLYKGEDTDPEVIFCSKKTYRIRDTLYFMWDDDEDSVFVYSGDTGTERWNMKNDELWVEEYPLGAGTEVPELLKKIKATPHN